MDRDIAPIRKIAICECIWNGYTFPPPSTLQRWLKQHSEEVAKGTIEKKANAASSTEGGSNKENLGKEERSM